MILLRVSLIFLVLFLLPDWYIYKTYLTNLHNRWNGKQAYLAAYCFAIAYFSHLPDWSRHLTTNISVLT